MLHTFLNQFYSKKSALITQKIDPNIRIPYRYGIKGPKKLLIFTQKAVDRKIVLLFKKPIIYSTQNQENMIYFHTGKKWNWNGCGCSITKIMITYGDNLEI